MFIPSKPFLPIDTGDSNTIEASCFPRQAIPAVVKLLIRRTYKSSWAKGQHTIGRDMIARCIVSLYAGCNNGTAASVDRVYRLLDSVFTGAQWQAGVDENNQPKAFPPIPAVPTFQPEADEALVRQVQISQMALYNLATGEQNEEFSDTRNIRSQLDEVIRLLGEGDAGNQEEILATLIQIAGLLA